MIDFGLLMSVIAALAVPSFVARAWPLRTFEPGTSFLDVVMVPAAVGLVAGRLATLALDDPSSIGRVSDMLIIRSGVEFWPAVLVATLLVAWSGRHATLGPLARVVDLAPLALIGYAAYEAACVFRDGCYGPSSPLGLRPDGIGTTMLPIGLLLSLGVVCAAIAVRHVAKFPWPLGAVVAAAIAFLGIARGIASIWLPKVGSSLTRQHRTSIAVAIIAAAACAVQVVRARRHAVEVADR